MKALRQILVASFAVVVGYALGRIGNEAPDARPSRLPESSASTPVAASSAEAEEAISSAMSALVDRGNFRELARLGTLLDALDSA